MDLGQPALRLFAIIAVVALPGLAALALVLAFAESWVASVGVGTVVLLIGLATLAWGALIAALTSRALSRDLQDVVAMATRGDALSPSPEGAEDDLRTAQRQLKSALDERNRQIATLASDVVGAPITGGPVEVAARVVGVARQVTGDPTWQLVALPATDAALPPGVYDDDPATPVRTVDELEQWAAVTGEPERLTPRHLIGPWGAVVVVDISTGDDLAGFLLAPWEGRPEPTPAERDLLSLIGQAAASALEHSVLYARLRTQTDELNRMAAVQSDFLRGITHDLQTPLTSIRALAAAIGEEAELNAQSRADLEAIAHQSDRLRRMVGQLLAVSRLDAGALEPRQEVFRVEPIIERTWEALRAGDRAFTLDLEGPMQLVVGDPDRLEQVLWAVLDNAVKYSPPASPISARVSADGNWRDISITDQGGGMSAEVRDRAFDQFFRSAEARRAAPDGSGIGLYAARGLMEAMGGSIGIESPAASGTTIRVRLPAEAVEGD